MCRWLVCFGKPVSMDKVRCGPTHSLIEQSLHFPAPVPAHVA